MIKRKWNRERFLASLDNSLQADKRWIAFIFLLAFILKVIFVLQNSESLQARVPILDAKYYDQMAQSIIRGGIIRGEAFFMGPLYSYVLAGIYAVFGRNQLIVGLIQMLGGAVTVVLTYLVGKKVFRPTTALLGALLLIFYGAATFYEGQLLMMWLGTLLNMLMLFFLFKASSGRSFLLFAAAGLAMGLSALARANILIFVPPVLIWILYFGGAGRGKAAVAVYTAAVIGAIVPVTLHNYAASRDFIPITSSFGVNFYIGNNENASGVFYPPMGVDFNSDATTRRYVERMLGRDMKPSQISGYWTKKVLGFMREQPGRELRLLLRKTALFFSGFEIPQIESYDLSRKRFGIFKFLFVDYWFLCAFGLAGFIFAFKEWKRFILLHLFVISYSLSIIIFFITARYRIQIVPVLSLFAAYGLVDVLPSCFPRPRRLMILTSFIAVTLYVNRPDRMALSEDLVLWREHIHTGRRWNEIGRTKEAIAEINKAVALRPQNPESYIHKAIIQKKAGKLFQAIEDFSRALEIDPGSASVHYDLAQAMREARMYETAAEEYIKAIELDSLMIEAYNNLGMTYGVMKKHEEAIKLFKKVIGMDPRYIKAYNNLGAALAENGDLDGALRSFSAALDLDPYYANAYKNMANVFIERNMLSQAKSAMQKYLDLSPGDYSAGKIISKIDAVIQRGDTLSGDER